MSWGVRFRSLRFRLPLLLLAYCGLVGVAIYAVVDRSQERRFEREFEAAQLARATELQERTERAAERGELGTAQREFGELAVSEPFRAGVFVGPDNHVLLASRREWRDQLFSWDLLGVPEADRARVGSTLDAFYRTRRTQRALFNGDNGLVLMLPAAMPVEPGVVEIDRSAMIVLVYDMSVSKAINSDQLNQLFRLIGAAVLVAVLILGVALHFFVTRRLERIRDLIARFAAGEPIAAGASRLPDEIGVIGNRFQDMARTVRHEMSERLEASAALRASEEKFRTAMTASPIGQALVALDGRWVEVNPALCGIVGYSEAELRERSFSDITHPDDVAQSLDLNEQLRSGAIASFQIDKRYIHKLGRVVWVQLNASAIRRGGQVEYVLSQIQDITERRLAAEQLTRVNRTLRTISHCNQALVHATDEAALLEEICRIIIEDAGYQLVWVAFQRGDSVFPAARAGNDGGYIDELLHYWNQPAMQELRRSFGAGLSVVTNDYATEPLVAPWRELALSRGFRSSASMPLRAGSRTFGVLMVYSDTKDAFDHQEMAMLTEMSEDLAYGVHALRAHTRQQRAEHALAASEALLRQLIKDAAAAVAMFDRDLNFLQTSDRWLNDYDLDGQEIIGRSLYDVFPDVPRRWKRMHQRVLAGAVERCDEDPIIGGDGRTRWLQWEARPWHRPDGSIGGLTMFTQFVTERKETEDAIRALNERYARHETALAALTRLHVQSPDQFADVLHSVTAIVSETLQLSRSAIWRPIGPDTLRNDSTCEWPSLRHTSGRELHGEVTTELTRMLAEADILAVQDTAEDPRTAEFARRFLREPGIQSMLAVPVRIKGDIAAILGCSQIGATRRWTPDEQAFAVAVANLLSSLYAQVDRLHLEAQLRQATKLEGIGQLAGGVAHDFNNVLTVILGKAGTLASDARMPDDLRRAAEDITLSGERAANLTRQLLAFSRRQAMQVRDLDLNAVIRNVVRLLDRILGEDLALHLELSPEPIGVRADAGMIDQVMLNLAVNARDAMKLGGRLTIATAVVNVDAQNIGRSNRPPGPYACVRVSDTGSGIAAEHLPHIFEPFFTTKDVGKGTGLGLATTYGIVEQHNGWIDVESEVGKGTAFSIYLPSFTEPVAQPATPAAVAPAAISTASDTGDETILVVEDEDDVRALIVDALAGFGYRVLAAASGPAALELWSEHHDTIDLLITDMVMPDGMNGLDLASRLSHDRPGLRIIYISGYLADVSRDALSQSGGASYLAKPFTIRALARVVRQSLDSVSHVES